MPRNFFLILCSVVIIAFAAPVAFAQTGGGDKVVFNETYTLAAGEVLNGSLAVFGGVVTLAPGSTVNGDVVVFGSSMAADGAITGSVAVFGGQVTLGETAVVEGDFAQLGGKVEQFQGAVIRGETLIGPEAFDFGDRIVPAPILDPPPPLARASGFLERFITWQLRTLGAGLLLALLGLVALLVAPKGVERIASAAAGQTAVSFGLGLLTLLLALFAGALLLIACGLGFLVWLMLLLGLVLGWIAVGLWVGQRLLALFRVQTASSVAEAIFGIFLITVLASLPFCIGFLAWLILGSIGLGAVVLTRFGTQAAEGALNAAPASVALDPPVLPVAPGSEALGAEDRAS